jgi:hypothetical protein
MDWTSSLTKIPLSKLIIQTKAKSLYDDIKKNRLFGDQENLRSLSETFEASNGWFETFKVRANLHSISLKGESACANTEAASVYTEMFKILIEEEWYESR